MRACVRACVFKLNFVNSFCEYQNPQESTGKRWGRNPKVFSRSRTRLWRRQSSCGSRRGPVDGMHFPPLRPGMTSWEDKIKELRQMKLRDDDVLLLTFPKAGTV